MRATKELQQLGQSLWLDNITRDLLSSGTLARYIDDYAITGLTSNPTIFEHAIGASDSYDAAIRAKAAQGESGEGLFFHLALEDLTHAADLFRPVFEKTEGVDGWVSLEVSPLLARDAQGTVAAALDLHGRANRPNLFIKIPGTPEGIVAIEEAIFQGVPVNVTLLFSPAQYLAAQEAYWRGLDRRVAAGRDPRVASVASLFVSRWDVAIRQTLPAELHNRVGIAIATQTYRAYRQSIETDRWLKFAMAGVLPQRLLFASTGAKDKAVSDTLYVERLAATDTINTMPEETLLAFYEHGKLSKESQLDWAAADAVISECRAHGQEPDVLALRLQEEGVAAFAASWRGLLSGVAAKADALVKEGAV
jgi:transaldolase